MEVRKQSNIQRTEDTEVAYSRFMQSFKRETFHVCVAIADTTMSNIDKLKVAAYFYREHFSSFKLRSSEMDRYVIALENGTLSQRDKEESWILASTYKLSSRPVENCFGLFMNGVTEDFNFMEFYFKLQRTKNFDAKEFCSQLSTFAWPNKGLLGALYG